MHAAGRCLPSALLGRNAARLAAIRFLLFVRARTGCGQRLDVPLIFADDGRSVDRGRRRQRGRGQPLVGNRARRRSVAVGHGASGVGTGLVVLVVAGRLGARDQVNERAQVSAADLHEVVAFLPEQPRDRPVPVDRDVHQGDPDPGVLHFRDDLGELFLTADDDGVADGPVPGQRGQVAVQLGLDALVQARPHPAQPQLEARDVGQRIVLGCPAALSGRLVPVAPQHGPAGAILGESGQELEQAGVVPGHRVPVPGAMDGHCAIGEHVARVYEQRATIHATTVLPSTRDVTSARPLP